MIFILFNLYMYILKITPAMFFCFSFLTSCFCSVCSNVFYCVTKFGYTLHFPLFFLMFQIVKKSTYCIGSQSHFMSSVFFYTWILLQAATNNSHSAASELSREYHQARAHWNRPSCEFVIASHDWPWLPGDANAQALGTAQPPLLLFTQRNTGPFMFSKPLIYPQTYRKTKQ